MAKRCPLIVLRFLLTLSLTLSPVLAQMDFPWNSMTSQHITVCNDKECQKRAKMIAESIDKKADPCEDFYQYVCGKWHTKNPIPPDEFEWTVEEKLDIKSIEEIIKILKYGASLNDPPDIKAAKKIYHICSNLPAMSKADAKHLRSIMKRAGPWPMFNTEHKSKVSWLDIHNYYLQITGDAGLFFISFHYDYKTNEILVHLNPAVPPFGLIQRFGGWSNDENIKHQYFLLILARMVTDKSNVPDEKNLIQDIIDVLAFRQRLEKNIRMDTVESSPMPIKYLQSWYGIKATSQKSGTKIPWLQIMREFFANTGFTITEDTKISMLYRDTIAHLPRLLSNTPKHVIANHLHLYFIEKHILVDEEVNNALSNLLISNGKIMGNTVSRLDRSKTCILMHPMKDTLGKLYVENYFSEEIRTSALQYGNKIKEMIKTHITTSNWLNDETMKKLVSKLDDVELNMGYRNQPKTENMDPKAIKMAPYRAVSFYVPKENSVFMGAGYFRSPVYGQNMPAAVNYGTISTFIAYEIYHALNTYHTHVDPMTSKGECKYCWSEAMQEMFRKKSKCFQEMYTDLVDKELEKVKPLPKTNGAQTLHENIADVMGIKTAMDAFKKVLWESHGKCSILPHLKDLTCEKLFFISYAATYCTVSPTWLVLKHMQTGTHSTSRLRVNIPLANMEEFRKAFKCSSNSPMVLKKSCFLW